MEIKSAEFVISNTDVRKCPEGNKPEYAFTGHRKAGGSFCGKIKCGQILFDQYAYQQEGLGDDFANTG